MYHHLPILRERANGDDFTKNILTNTHSVSKSYLKMPPFNDVRNMVYTQAIRQPSLPDADLSGKTYAITGANAGLGFETVIFVSRN